MQRDWQEQADYQRRKQQHALALLQQQAQLMGGAYPPYGPSALSGGITHTGTSGGTTFITGTTSITTSGYTTAFSPGAYLPIPVPPTVMPAMKEPEPEEEEEISFGTSFGGLADLVKGDDNS